MVTLAGAMSTAELGVSLAEMIRQNKVHSISCTGANLEEDLFNLVANSHYERVPHYRYLTAQMEKELLGRKLARVTDTCIPEDEAMRNIESHVLALWRKAESEKKRYFPHEIFYQLILSGELKDKYDADPKDSWLVAAAEKNLPIWTPGWEDSTIGNAFAAALMAGKVKSPHTIKMGVEAFTELAEWYQTITKDSGIGFFQIGGGIAGDYPICIVPMINYDLKQKAKLWSYFCQISDSTTSYGSYSGAVPNEKITWGKVGLETPTFVIESDATIVAPLIFAYVLGW